MRLALTLFITIIVGIIIVTPLTFLAPEFMKIYGNFVSIAIGTICAFSVPYKRS